MMPRMNSKTAICTLKQIDPELKIIAISGLIDRQEIVTELDGAVTTFINKPYANEDLFKVFREIVIPIQLMFATDPVWVGAIRE